MRADYVVVGGGVFGCATAWDLARRGWDVVLLEAGTIAGGASGGVGERGVRANGRDPRELPLMARAYERWAGLADALQTPIGYRRIGHLQLIEREADLTPAAGAVERQRQHAIPTDFIDAAAVRRLEPDVSPTILGAVHCPLDGVVDHTAVTQGLARAARQSGAQVVTGRAALELRQTGARIDTVLTDEDDVAVGRGVIVTCNVGAVALLAPLHLPVFPVLPQVLLTEPVEPDVVHHLIGHAHRRLALKALPDRRLMVTGGWLGRWDARAGRGVVADDQVAGNWAEAVRVFPRLEGVQVTLAVADRLEAIAPDMVPIIDRVPGTTNALFATGWSGHGWAIAPVVSELLVEWALTDRRPEPLAPFALDRFQPPPVT